MVSYIQEENLIFEAGVVVLMAASIGGSGGRDVKEKNKKL